jgi:oligopeptide transport permease C-like protein
MTNPPEFQVTSGGAVALQPVAVARKSPSRLFWDRFRQDKAALVGGVVIGLLVLIAIAERDLRQHDR